MKSRGITRHITDLDTNLIKMNNNSTSSVNSTLDNKSSDNLELSNEFESSHETLQATEDNNPQDFHANVSSK